MIDNFDLIKDILKFDDKYDFYYVMILKRKKDQSTDKANHQSVRTIKTYAINSIDEFLNKKEDIVRLCEMFNSRAYIYPQRKNHNSVTINIIEEICKRMKSGHLNQTYIFDHVVSIIEMKDTIWVVDIDDKDETNKEEIINCINSIRPIGDKVIQIIPTFSCFRLLTKKCDVLEFNKRYNNIDVHKKNPTLLYYPKSLYEKNI